VDIRRCSIRPLVEAPNGPLYSFLDLTELHNYPHKSIFWFGARPNARLDPCIYSCPGGTIVCLPWNRPSRNCRREGALHIVRWISLFLSNASRGCRSLFSPPKRLITTARSSLSGHRSRNLRCATIPDARTQTICQRLQQEMQWTWMAPRHYFSRLARYLRERSAHVLQRENRSAGYPCARQTSANDQGLAGRKRCRIPTPARQE